MAVELQRGLVGEARRVVGGSDLADALGSGTIRVFGTPAMVALMEAAAVEAVDRLLPEGWASVGTRATSVTSRRPRLGPRCGRGQSWWQSTGDG